MTITTALQGDTLDAICQRHLGTTGGGVVERTLQQNPGLASLGPVLPAGTRVVLAKPTTTTDKTVKLWE